MSYDQLKKLRQNEDFVNEMLSRPITSYSDYKQREEDTKVLLFNVNDSPLIEEILFSILVYSIISWLYVAAFCSLFIINVYTINSQRKEKLHLMRWGLDLIVYPTIIFYLGTSPIHIPTLKRWYIINS